MATKPLSLTARSGAIVLSFMAFALSACSRHEDPVPVGQVAKTIATVQAALVANGSACLQATDCASGFCSAGTCAGCKVAGATSTSPLGSDGRCNSPSQYCNLNDSTGAGACTARFTSTACARNQQCAVGWYCGGGNCTQCGTSGTQACDNGNPCAVGARCGPAPGSGHSGAGFCELGTITAAPSGSLCPPDGSVCTTDMCNGTSTTCQHAAGNSGAACHASGGECDSAATCTGSSTTCPSGLKATGTACTDDGNACTTDTCNGTSAACQHPAGNAGVTCHTSGGVCDTATICTGTSTTCPSGLKASGTTCRAAADVCDIAESCTGSSAACPTDGFQPSSVACRAQVDVCDAAENCTGSSATCPADGFQPSSTVCRPPASVCDAAENCTGSSTTCPADVNPSCPGDTLGNQGSTCPGTLLTLSGSPLQATTPVTYMSGGPGHGYTSACESAGADFVWRFAAPVSGQVTVTMNFDSAAFNGSVSVRTGNCGGNDCVSALGCDDTLGSGVVKVSFKAKACTTYFLVADKHHSNTTCGAGNTGNGCGFTVNVKYDTQCDCGSPGCASACSVDGVKNGDETDVDCGGSCAPCPLRKGCLLCRDCQTGSTCQNGACVDSSTDTSCGPGQGLASSTWPLGRGCPNRRGFALSSVSRAVPTSATWSFAAGASVRSSPVLANDGTIYFGSDDAYLYALNPNGSQKWRFLTGGAVESVPAVGADGTIYFGSDDNQVRALTPAGNLLWARSTGASVRSSPVAGPDGTVYVGSDDGYLYALNHATGAVLWRQNLGGLVRSSPALGAYGATIYVGSDDFKLRALTTATGTVKWVLATGGAVRSSPAIGPDGTIYFGSDDAFVYAVRDNGVAASLVWRQQTGGIVHSSPALGTDGTLYVGSDDTLLYALDSGATATTRVKWTFQTGGLVKGSPVVTSDGLILVPSLDHKLHLLSKNGTLAWSFDLGAEVWSSPAVVRDGTVIIGADSNKLVKVGTPALGIPVVAVSSRILRDRTTPLVVSATVPINALPVDPACPTCATFLTADVMILQQHTGVRMRSFSAPVVPVTSTGPITLSAVWDGKIVRSGVLIPAPDDAYLVGVAPVLARQPALTVEAPIPVTGPAYGAGPGDFGVTFAESFAPPQQFRVCMTYGCPDAPIIAQQTDSVCQLLHGADLGLPFVHSINGVLTHGMIFGDASPTAAGGVSTSNVPQYAISTTPVPTLGGLVGNDDIGALLGLQPPSTANLDAHVAPQCDIAPVFATDASGGIVPLSYIAPFGSGGTSGGAYMGPLFVPGPGFSLDFAPSRPRSLPRRREETRGIA